MYNNHKYFTPLSSGYRTKLSSGIIGKRKIPPRNSYVDNITNVSARCGVTLMDGYDIRMMQRGHPFLYNAGDSFLPDYTHSNLYTLERSGMPGPRGVRAWGNSM